MILEILRTYVTLEANNHNVKPKNMTIGGFNVTLDGISVSYDNYESYGGWGEDNNGPVIEWVCRGGADVFMVDEKEIEKPEEYIFTNFKEIPSISSITEIFYEAFTDADEGVEYEFYPTEFAIEIVDRENNSFYTIEASTEVIQAYINSLIDEGELTSN